MLRALSLLTLSALFLFPVTDASAADIPQRAEDVTPLGSGEAAPTFKAQTADGQAFEFDAESHQGKTLMIFYRGGWCPYCNRHLMALRDVVPTLKGEGVEVLFLSADKPELLYESLEDPTLDYTLLSDAAMHASRAFGIAFQVDDDTVARYKGFGIDLEESSGYDHHLLPVPAVYLIEDGKIAFMHADADYKKRLEASAILSAAGVSGD